MSHQASLHSLVAFRAKPPGFYDIFNVALTTILKLELLWSEKVAYSDRCFFAESLGGGIEPAIIVAKKFYANHTVRPYPLHCAVLTISQLKGFCKELLQSVESSGRTTWCLHRNYLLEMKRNNALEWTLLEQLLPASGHHLNNCNRRFCRITYISYNMCY